MVKPILLGKENFFQIGKEQVGVDKLKGSAYAHAPFDSSVRLTVGSSVRLTRGSTPERAQVKPTANSVRAKVSGTTSTSPSPICRIAAQPGESGNTANPRKASNNDGFIGTPPARGLHAAQPVKAAPVLESPGRAKVLSCPQGALPAQEPPKPQEAIGPAKAHGGKLRVWLSKEPLRLPHDAAKEAAVPATPPSSRPGVVEPTKNEAAAAELVQVAFADASAMSVEDLMIVEQFIGGLKTLSTWYGENLIADCEREFRSGYSDEELAH